MFCRIGFSLSAFDFCQRNKSQKQTGYSLSYVYPQLIENKHLTVCSENRSAFAANTTSLDFPHPFAILALVREEC